MKFSTDKTIESIIESAKSLYNDACLLPSDNKHNATKLFLLLSSWENVERAAVKWSKRNHSGTPVELNEDKDHGIKMWALPLIEYSGPLGIKKKYDAGFRSSPSGDMKRLREMTLYGVASYDRQTIFSEGWDVESLQESLRGKLEITSTIMAFSEGKERTI